MELNYDFFYKWAKQYLKLNLDSYKEKQLQRRIATVMKNTGAATLEEYALEIQRNPAIKQRFLDYITINVTDFFRNQDIFEEFEEQLVQQLAPKFSDLKIWSAACSIGSEPYSMAMMLDKHGIATREKILATDIDETILKRAKEGIYSEIEMKNIRATDWVDYFDLAEKTYYLSPAIKQKVRFKKHDLIADPYPDKCHVILCRNVTIYFKNDVKDEMYRKFSEALVPGGLFFTGATETIYDPKAYGLRKISSFIYEKEHRC
ncbi:CheR family methyltransferase [Pisciglobus halotolerans]|uniref:Chemotaxis protein methyltransferase CheR n=1 Tax=Pisciglobus halotolerans TaxID=745365 RepID=A0A1I3ANW0_9LACT|nr:protein-glutamate O-methyltransferase CheR [Pisciglobus halotolerans]SFH51724.1 chemotaxis protein methyltransferase CheR [Pisciglobus halotolerans]